MDIIRRHTDYAVRALLHLADSGGRALTGRQLADYSDIPISFAYKVLKMLGRADIVVSRRGRPGGFRLSRCPEDVSLQDVVEAVQGPVSVSQCVLDPSVCGRSETCPVSATWFELQHDMVRFLKATSIADLQQGAAASAAGSRKGKMPRC